MICKFCNQQCLLNNRSSNYSIDNCVCYHHCIPCNINYFNTFYVLNTTINNIDYYVIYSNEPNFNPVFPTTVYKALPNHIKLANNENIVLQFDSHIIFTPSNFNHKLKTYLLLS